MPPAPSIDVGVKQKMTWYTIIGGAIVIMLLYSYLAHKKWKWDLAKLNRSRPKLSKNEYIDILETKGYSRNDISIAYDVIQNYIDMPDFSMYPNDDFTHIYGIDSVDYEDLITEVYKKVDRPLPTQKYFEELNKKYMKDMNVEYVLELLKYNSQTPTTE